MSFAQTGISSANLLCTILNLVLFNLFYWLVFSPVLPIHVLPTSAPCHSLKLEWPLVAMATAVVMATGEEATTRPLLLLGQSEVSSAAGKCH